MDVSSNPNQSSVKIGTLVLDDFALMSYASTVEPVRAANLLSGQPLYQLTHFCANNAAATSSSGIVIKADKSLQNASDMDILFVIAGGNPARFSDQRVFDVLKRLAGLNVVLGGVSGAPFVLANAGVMRGRRMTIHWEHAASLIEHHPDLLLNRSLYVIDRDRITCAGGTAPLDMMHALIAGRHGVSFARSVSDWFMHTEVRPAGGRQRSGLVERYNTSNAAVIESIEIMENHIADPLSLSQLADLCNLSQRQLNRLFTDNLRQGTMAFYRQLRLEFAAKICRQSSLSFSEIAEATGFSSLSHFSTAFRDFYQQTPSVYRAKID